MKRRTLNLGAILVAAALCVVVPLIVTAMRGVERDPPNYTVSPDLTQRVIKLFDSLGARRGELMMVGGRSQGRAVGSTGLTTVTRFDLKDRRQTLGLHRLTDHDRVAIRFSLLPAGSSPNQATELSSSLDEDEPLRKSFGALLKRLEAIEPHTRTLLLDDAWGGNLSK